MPVCLPFFPFLLDSSQEYTDSTGIDVHEFLVNTLKNNPRYEITIKGSLIFTAITIGPQLNINKNMNKYGKRFVIYIFV